MSKITLKSFTTVEVHVYVNSSTMQVSSFLRHVMFATLLSDFSLNREINAKVGLAKG